MESSGSKEDDIIIQNTPLLHPQTVLHFQRTSASRMNA